MRYRAICISRTVGAGGEQVGRLVAEGLGFHYFDDEVIRLASEKAGLERSVVAAAEHHTGLITRLIDALIPTPRTTKGYFEKPDVSQGYVSELPPSAAPPSEELRQLIHGAILEIARRGDAVIVAHAASMHLADRNDVLRVFITASPKTRARRLWLSGKLLTEEGYAQAVDDSDRERQRYLHRFFDVKDELPTYCISCSTRTRSTSSRR